MFLIPQDCTDNLHSSYHLSRTSKTPQLMTFEDKEEKDQMVKMTGCHDNLTVHRAPSSSHVSVQNSKSKTEQLPYSLFSK